MNKAWPMVPLAEVLTERKEVPSADDLATGKIRIVAKVGFNDGRIQLRADGQTKTGMILIRPGDLVISGINAAKGAVAVYGKDNTEPIAATIHYGAYTPNKARVDVSYLWWLLRSGTFRNLLLQYVPGGIKTELKAKRLLPIPIPLPSLSEQQRIVARIEKLAAKVEEARRLRREAETGCDTLCRSIIFDRSDGEPAPIPMRELLRLREPDVFVSAGETYQFAGVYCFGGGVFKGKTKSGAEFSYARLTRLRSGDFVYPKLMAWEGALGVVPPECDDLVVSTEFPVFEVDQDRVLSETLDVYFRTPSVWPLLSASSTGTNVRRRRLNPEDFLAYKMPLPSMLKQKRLREVKGKVDVLKRLQATTAAEIDAMLPSVLHKAFKGEL